VSLGTGIVNWLFAIPAVYTIDTFGRRNLLLTTFPLMGIFLLFTGFSFFIISEQARLACVATGIYLFMAVYSPGEGPVPFTYSAEAFPLYVREYGMAFATATTWGFNFILSLTWPALVQAFTAQGAFGWYAAWNFFGWTYAYFCLQETKGLSLEELDTIFSVSVRAHARYYKNMLPWYFNKYIKRGDVQPRKLLYDLE
jgi:MFS family permease